MKIIKNFIKKLIFGILCIVVFVSGLFIGAGWIKYKDATTSLPLDEAVSLIRAQDNFTKLDDISLHFVNAMVAVEDRRFYKHQGVDVIGVVRAMAKNIKNKSLEEGGSCITQQLAKNLYFINDNTLLRKIAEVFVAIELERNYSKKEILELYFNKIYYGSGYYNIYDASIGYFNKKPSELTRYESTLLGGIPNAPSVYSLKNNPELAKKRQVTVVEAMLEVGYLTDVEAAGILAQQ